MNKHTSVAGSRNKTCVGFVRDHTDDGQRFPLTTFLELLLSSGTIELSDQITIANCWGYGKKVCDWEDKIDLHGHVEIPFAELLELTRNSDQWFYDLKCRDANELVFGVFDSSALFLKGTCEFVERIVGSFRNYDHPFTLPSGAGGKHHQPGLGLFPQGVEKRMEVTDFSLAKAPGIVLVEVEYGVNAGYVQEFGLLGLYRRTERHGDVAVGDQRQ